LYIRSNGRSSWGNNRDRRDPYRDYDSHRRDRTYSPPQRREMSPPHAKRMRRDTWFVDFFRSAQYYNKMLTVNFKYNLLNGIFSYISSPLLNFNPLWFLSYLHL
jgi:hypothetical protein